MTNFSAISWIEQVTFQWDDDNDDVLKNWTSNFSYIMVRTSYISIWGGWTSMLSSIFIVLAHWNNSRWVDMSLHTEWLQIPSQPLFTLTPWCCVLSGEAANTNIIVFGLTRPRLEPTISFTWSEHTNHYTTDYRLPETCWEVVSLRTDRHEDLVRPENILPVRKKSTKKFTVMCIMFSLAFLEW
jgi:hypothetical protein